METVVVVLLRSDCTFEFFKEIFADLYNFTDTVSHFEEYCQPYVGLGIKGDIKYNLRLSVPTKMTEGKHLCDL